MGLPLPATFLFFGILLEACCSPNRCHQAKTGAMVLDSAIGKIEQYKERNGRYPIILDDIEKGLGAKVEQELKANCPDCTDLKYKTDPFGFEMEYRYYQMGKIVCRYDTEGMKWICRGEY